MAENKLNKIASLCKRRGFVYQTSEIYGGLAGFYDYGPLGAEIIRNLKNLWWQDMVHQRDNIYGIDGSIILHPKVWLASGHIEGFDDPLIECNQCQKRFRVDKLDAWSAKKNNQGEWEIIKKGSLDCPECSGQLIPEIKQFNLMMETSLGSITGEKEKAYLKGESCQNIYLNYKPILDTLSPKIPFGIGQIGRTFRNEITLGKFIFKLREFEQWDIEYFVQPDKADEAYKEWKEIRWNWFVKRLKIDKKNLRWRQHTAEELIFYAQDAWDIEYKYPFGWDELEGLHHRSDYDLKQHSKYSGQDLTYTNQNGEKFYPYIIESSGGVDRTFLVLLLDAYHEEKVNNKNRTLLKLDPRIAPYKVAVFPLLSNKEKLVSLAKKVYQQLKKKYHVDWDEHGNIGKRYRRQDEIGTPWCVTIDFDTLKDNTITVRDRDTMEQIRVDISQLEDYLNKKINELR